MCPGPGIPQVPVQIKFNLTYMTRKWLQCEDRILRSSYEAKMRLGRKFEEKPYSRLEQEVLLANAIVTDVHANLPFASPETAKPRLLPVILVSISKCVLRCAGYSEYVDAAETAAAVAKQLRERNFKGAGEAVLDHGRKQKAW